MLTEPSQPPPANSRPEAFNFPTTNYSMSEDPQLFRPPTYPEPPKGVHQASRTSWAAERPKPIFPWENNQPKPTRVFADDFPAISSEQTPSEEAQSQKTSSKEVLSEETLSDTAPSATTDDDTPADTPAETSDPSTPVAQVRSPEPFALYSRTNAWDDVPEIERYISNLPQNRRGKVQVLYNSSISKESDSSSAIEASKSSRRPSMKLTDFPTEIERPSLPVTPAPVRRPSFWGEERDAAGELPGAEGVPEQSDWDPTARLVELQRRQSEVLAQGPTSPTRAIPDRQLPGSAAPVPIPEESAVPPTFGQLNFAGSDVSRGSENEAVLSPIQTAG